MKKKKCNVQLQPIPRVVDFDANDAWDDDCTRSGCCWMKMKDAAGQQRTEHYGEQLTTTPTTSPRKDKNESER